MKHLAVIVSRGEFNSLVQVTTLLMAAVASGIAIRVFFRDEAIYKITRAGARDTNLSEAYRGQEAAVSARLAAQELADLLALWRQIKETGDARLYACSSSMAICGVDAGELLPEIDEIRGLTNSPLNSEDLTPGTVERKQNPCVGPSNFTIRRSTWH